MISDEGIMARPGDRGKRDLGQSRLFCVSVDERVSFSWNKGRMPSGVRSVRLEVLVFVCLGYDVRMGVLSLNL
jgi:hypothetical protein